MNKRLAEQANRDKSCPEKVYMQSNLYKTDTP